MKGSLQAVAALLGIVPACVAIATIASLGLARGAGAAAVWASAAFLVLAPAAISALVAPRSRLLIFGLVAAGWSVALVVGTPIYFPGEGATAWTRPAHDAASPQGLLEVAEPTAEVVPGPARQLDDHEIALPYEGDGRSLSVEIAVEHGGVVRDIPMILDTGASLTTLPPWLLQELGASPPSDAPVLRFQTANGPREAPLVLLDKVWLGDMPIEGVAVSPCVACEDEQSMGLLGLNVTKGFNFTIDADRKEVIFTRRDDVDRLLDIKHWLDVNATITRMPGHVQVEVRVQHNGSRDVGSVTAGVRCEEQEWSVQMGGVKAGETVSQRRRLPAHEPCDRYVVDLLRADW